MTQTRLSPGTFLRLVQRADAPTGVPIPAPPAPPEPYEVRIRESLGDTILLIGHNGAGRPFSEWRIPRRKLSPRIVERFGRWCRENDDAPELHVVR